MYAPVHHGNNPLLYSNYRFKGKGRRHFRAPGRRFIVRCLGFFGQIFCAPGKKNIEGRGFITTDQATEGLSKAMKVGVPPISKLMKGVSKRQRRKMRRSRKKKKLRKLKVGTLFTDYMQSPMGKGMFGFLAAMNLASKKKII